MKKVVNNGVQGVEGGVRKLRSDLGVEVLSGANVVEEGVGFVDCDGGSKM